MHRVANELKFNKELKQAYGDDVNKPAKAGQKTIDEVIENIPTLKDKYSSFGGKVKVNYVDKFISSSGADAITYPIDDEPFSKPSVSVFRASFSSYKYLAQTIYHEFVHVGDFLSGRIFTNFKKYSNAYEGKYSRQKAWSIAVDLSEIRAYQIGYKVTGLPYKNNSGYLKSVNSLKASNIKF